MNSRTLIVSADELIALSEWQQLTWSSSLWWQDRAETTSASCLVQWWRPTGSKQVNSQATIQLANPLYIFKAITTSTLYQHKLWWLIQHKLSLSANYHRVPPLRALQDTALANGLPTAKTQRHTKHTWVSKHHTHPHKECRTYRSTSQQKKSLVCSFTSSIQGCNSNHRASWPLLSIPLPPSLLPPLPSPHLLLCRLEAAPSCPSPQGPTCQAGRLSPCWGQRWWGRQTLWTWNKPERERERSKEQRENVDTRASISGVCLHRRCR